MSLLEKQTPDYQIEQPEVSDLRPEPREALSFFFE